MNKKALFIAPITAILLSMSGVGLAATGSDGSEATPNAPGAMQQGQRGMGQGQGMMGQGQGMMGQGQRGMGQGQRGMGQGQRGMGQGKGMMGHGMMMGGGMMGHGMMMGNCPMMDAESGLNRKVMMQMRGEMMRAIGEIMIKYADKIETPESSD